MASTLELTNIGAIEKLSIPLPEGGIVVLNGTHGVGKSTALDSIDAHLSGDGQLNVRDGAPQAKIEGLGVTMTFKSRSSRKGKLEVEALSDSHRLWVFVDPGIKDPLRADAERVKSLVDILGIKATAEEFIASLDPKGTIALSKILSDKSRRAATPLELAASLKQDLQAAAREQEKSATESNGSITALNEKLNGLDLKAESDAGTLQDALEEAIRNSSAITERCSQVVKSRNERKVALEALKKAQAEYTGPTVEVADADLRAAEKSAKVATEAVEAAKAALQKAQADAVLRATQLNGARAARDAAVSHAALIANWDETLSADAIEAPSDGEILAAEKAVTDARAAVELGVRVRDGITAKEKVESLTKSMNSANARAAQLRKASDRVDNVLSDLVAKSGSPITIRDGRVYAPGDDGKPELFERLSDGEKGILAIDLGINAIGERGIFTIPQNKWEGISPSSRKQIADHARERGVVGITAEVSDAPAIEVNSI